MADKPKPNVSTTAPDWRGKVAPARDFNIPSSVVQRVAQGINSMRALAMSGAAQSGSPRPGLSNPTFDMNAVAADGWFGPSVPMVAMAPRDQVAGRAWDYPTGYNIQLTPRQDDNLSFSQLRALAEALDLVKLCVETRKDQLENLQGSVLPKKAGPDDVRQGPDDRCREIEDFLQRPDRKLTFDMWRRELAHEMLTIDAPAIYVRRTVGGGVYSLDIVDGALITPKIGLDGRAPDAPDTAYQQNIKGLPAVDYTRDELLYWPRNRRANKIYGFSPVEQIAMTMNIAIRREVAKLSYFTEGNIPDAMMPVPPGWTPDQISAWQKAWNALMEDVRDRSGKLKFIPGGGGQVQFLRNDTLLFGQPDEWFARVICYAFSLPSLPFVAQQNRATAETSQEAAIEEGLKPLMAWFKSLMDHIIQIVFGYADLEWTWADDDIEPAEVAEIYAPLFDRGIVSGDQILGKLGMAPIGLKPFIKGIGPAGFMFVEDMLKAQELGLTMPQAPPASGAMPGAPLDPGPAAPASADPNQGYGVAGIPQGAFAGVDPGPDADSFDPLDGVSPDLLTAVGLTGGKLGAKKKKPSSVDPVAMGVLHQFEQGRSGRGTGARA